MSQPVQPVSTVNVTSSASTTPAGGRSGEENTVAFSDLLASPQNPDQAVKTAGRGAEEMQDSQKPAVAMPQGNAEQSSLTSKQLSEQKAGSLVLAESQGLAETTTGLITSGNAPPKQLSRSQQNESSMQADGTQDSEQAAQEVRPVKISSKRPGGFAQAPDHEPGAADAESQLVQLLQTGMAVFPAHSANIAEDTPSPAGGISRSVPNPEPDSGIARMVIQLPGGDIRGDVQKHALVNGRNLSADLTSPVSGSRFDAAALASVTEALTEPAQAASSGRIHIPVGQQGWGGAVAEQVVWFVSQHVNAANLRLNPQHLGPLEMHVRMDGDQANVTFMSHNPAVREALESAIPRLREMFGENGLSLASVNVSQQGNSEQRNPGLPGSAYSNDATLSSSEHAEEEMSQDNLRISRAMLGLVDYYV